MQPTSSTTIAELAAGSMAAVRVFERFGIDYCCGGKRPLEAVCREQGIDSAAVAREIEAAGQIASDGTDWNVAPLTALVQHIVATHHEFLKLELHRITDRFNRVLAAHGQRDLRLADAREVFGGLKSELLHHLHKEEMVLFPAIERLEREPDFPVAALAGPISVMENEHQDAGDALTRLHELMDDFAAPAHACNTYRALLSGLVEMEEDLHIHIHLENNILFPRALKAAASR